MHVGMALAVAGRSDAFGFAAERRSMMPPARSQQSVDVLPDVDHLVFERLRHFRGEMLMVEHGEHDLPPPNARVPVLAGQGVHAPAPPDRPRREFAVPPVAIEAIVEASNVIWITRTAGLHH